MNFVQFFSLNFCLS